jgi:hypothetical protein
VVVPDVAVVVQESHSAELEALRSEQDRLLASLQQKHQQELRDAERAADDRRQYAERKLKEKLDEEQAEALSALQATLQSRTIAATQGNTDQTNDDAKKLIEAHKLEVERVERQMELERSRQLQSLSAQQIADRQRRIAELRARQANQTVAEKNAQTEELLNVRGAMEQESERDFAKRLCNQRNRPQV